jgi:hypothetical protein
VQLSGTLGLEPIVLEYMRVEAFEGDRLEEPRRHDPVGVHVLAANRQGAS